ncbi:hypothetical protein J7E99_31360, partial [Streptomyces sp. ISL-44]|uniref:hypothetical protein n=1 Tax=Streptomyces sp. ISL-44 TaxID=2819184 RepID=UPI001BE804EE
AISSGGATVSTKASDVHASFGGLQAFYQAPEADQLFATTKPVSDLGLKLSSDMCTIAGALGTYSRDAAPVIKKLENLRAEAQAFREKTDKDKKWREDGDLIDENLDRRNEIAEVWEEFHNVEKACHAKIVALVGGKPLKTDDGSHGEGMYGYDAEALKQSKSLPWGDAVEESIPGWQFWEHGWEFTKGFFVDGVWGTLKGLGGLVGLQGWDTFKQSWTGLAKLSTGLGIAMMPGVGPLFMAIPDDKLPSYLRESRNAMKETGKALLAWDQWGSNPGRAAGAVTFNVITTIATGGTGGAVSGAGKAGAVAKALSLAGKAGRVVDPMTYIMKGAGAGISKAGDVMAALKGLGKIEAPNINIDGAIALPEGAVHLPDGAIHLPSGSAVPDGAIKLPDGNIKLPEGTATLPPGTVKLPFDDTPAKYVDGDGNLYKEDGSVLQRGDDAKVENTPATKPGAGAPQQVTAAGNPPLKPDTDVPQHATPAKVPERVLAGVGARGDDAIRLDSNLSNPVHVPDHTPGPRPDITPGGLAPDNMPRNSTDPHTPSTGGGRPETPSTGGGRPETPSTGGGRPETPSTGGGRPETPSTGGGRPETPSTGGGRPETPSTGGGRPETPETPGGGRPETPETPGGKGHTDGPSAGDGPETPGGGGGTGDGPGNGSGMPEQQPAVILEGPRIGQQPSGPMSPEREAAVTEALQAVKVPPVDQGRMLVQLKKSEYGAAVAEYIASGRFADTPGFKNPEGLLFQVKQGDMIPAVHQALEHAAELQAKGLKGIEFEVKLPGEKLDLDVLVRHDGRIEYGAQLKDVDSVAGIRSAVKKIANKQLLGALDDTGLPKTPIDVKAGILDIRGLKAELTERDIQAVQQAADRCNASFELKFDNGSVTIFPTNASKP